MPNQPLNREDQISELKGCIYAIKKRLDLIRPLYERSIDNTLGIEIESLEVQYEDLLQQLRTLTKVSSIQNKTVDTGEKKKNKKHKRTNSTNDSKQKSDDAKKESKTVPIQKEGWQPSKIRRSNSMIRDISKPVKTVPLMDSFQASDKEYLLLGGIAPQCGIRNVYLVIHRFHVKIPHIKSELKLSDLKKEGREKLRKGLREGAESLGDSNPWYPLCKEYNNDNVALLQEQNYFFFSKAIEIGAQTSLDRTGYGSVYQGGKTDFMGTHYGETTSFLIVGATLTLTE